MKSSTRNIIAAALGEDNTLTETERAAAATLMFGATAAATAEHNVPRFVSYREAAAAIGKTVTRVHQLARAGRLKEIRGEKRGIGITEESFRAFLANTCPIGGDYAK